MLSYERKRKKKKTKSLEMIGYLNSNFAGCQDNKQTTMFR